MKRSAQSLLVCVIGAGLVACASGAKRSAEAPASAPPAAAGYPQPAYQAPSPAADADAMREPSPAQPSAGPQTPGQYAPPPPNRSVALGQASNDIEASQRELDVAGGDCRNACRALGSMDRAAGRLCGLAQSNDEQRRCGDAKARVYSARDKVRNTCGSCPDVSVDRTDPIPSR
ncbi:MAG: hypothetical protein KF795_06050 [Labilithrix sp.]|nr:hypothetical protein [Labilithrix sp.]